MATMIEFGRKVPLSATTETEQEHRIMAAAGLTSGPDVGQTEASLRIVASDLARKHGISIERAGMLVDRFGRDRHTLERAAQVLRTRMD